MFNVNESNFEETIGSSSIVLLDFYGSWCPPCNALVPILENIEKDMGDLVKFGKINVSEETELAASYKITAIPAILIFKDEKIAECFVGIQKEQFLRDKLRELLDGQMDETGRD